MAPSLTRSAAAAAIALILAGPALAEMGEQATKGWELYSYRDNGEWRFSLLFGTDRFKFCSEIRNPRSAKTLEQLEHALRRIAAREYLSWWGPDDAAFKRDNCGVAYPEPEIVARIRQLSRRLELNYADDALPRMDSALPQ
jgi:hypothetical protein